MTPRIIRRTAAEWDLTEYVDRIAVRSVRAALRFLAEMEAAFERLARMPGIGSPFRDASLADMRFWPVPRMRNFVIIYRPLKDGIEVVRVIRGARNWRALFGG